MKIYRIKNLLNGKVYIGQTKHKIHTRWLQHANNSATDSAVTAAIRKYGRENFTIEELASADTQDQLDILECTYIELNKSMAPNGYNLKGGGLEGSRYSEQSRLKMSESKLGKPIPNDVKEKMSIAHIERFKDPLLRIARSKQSKAIWENKDYRDNIGCKRKEYWSHEENRQAASTRAKLLQTDELRNLISEKVKEAQSSEKTQIQMKEVYKNQEVPVVRSDGTTFSSIKNAALATGVHSSSIVKQISGHYKTSGGFTFKYLIPKNEPPTLNTVYMVCGASGSGKSWVCKQLLDLPISYVSYDEVSKKDHLSTIQACTQPVLFDPCIKISTFIKKHKSDFNLVPIFIIESEEVMRARIEERGGTWTPHIMRRSLRMERLNEKYGLFAGTSTEVLQYLRESLC